MEQINKDLKPTTVANASTTVPATKDSTKTQPETPKNPDQAATVKPHDAKVVEPKKI